MKRDQTRWAEQRLTKSLPVGDRRRRLPKKPVTSFVDLTGNDYLGLSSHPRVRQALIGALEPGEPVGSTGSRLLTGNHPLLRAAEEKFCTWQGAEASLLYGSGYAANIGVLTAVLMPQDVVISDSLNHASLIDGLRLSKAKRVIVNHLDFSSYERALQEHRGQPCWVVVESVYSMNGDLAPISGLLELCAHYNAQLIADEAHATGLWGPAGEGRCSPFRRHPHLFATIHPCGKAIGLQGAFVCGSRALKTLLINRSRSFIYSTAPLPCLGAALCEAVDVIENSPQLRQIPIARAQQFRRRMSNNEHVGGHDSQIVPIVVGADRRALQLAAFLQERRWGVLAIRPPTIPEGQSRIRLSFHAGLSVNDVEMLATDVEGGLRALRP